MTPRALSLIGDMKMGPSQTASAAGVSRLDLSLVTSLKLSISASAFETPPFDSPLPMTQKSNSGRHSAK